MITFCELFVVGSKQHRRNVTFDTLTHTSYARNLRISKIETIHIIMQSMFRRTKKITETTLQKIETKSKKLSPCKISSNE